MSVVGAIVLGLSGCSSGSDSDTATQEPSSTTPASAAFPTSSAVSPSATPTSATSTTSAAPTPAPLAADQLVLSADQLPGAGWKPDDDGDPESAQRQPASQPECSNQSWTLRTEEMTDQAGAGWYFDQAAEVEAITSQAFVYRNEQAAATALAAYRAVVERCVSWQMGAGAAGYTFQEGQELFDAAVGDESVALMQTTAMVRYPDAPASSSYWVSARVGATIVQVTYRPGSLLGSGQGKTQAVDLAATAAAQAQTRTG
ncbi:hypothetical protein M1M07_10880 [Rhodococcus sp. HM1]|uniref:hypothetical protein n=1 Tax=Rhodococcus sp. HM1 TaxID=2937759 RepID=UPI00200B7616|nr:hypothetical protein [Rhodococcus sp. HM1]MCK8671620.1 hypothetical protein [Rhodococcus sp. HM1]